jgi:hypothetical protein
MNWTPTGRPSAPGAGQHAVVIMNPPLHQMGGRLGGSQVGPGGFSKIGVV